MVEYITKNDMVALRFRDKLINLCKEYNCEISGSNRDDGNIALEITNREENETSYYTIEPSINYNLSQDNEEYRQEYVMDKIIKAVFNQESGEMAGLNNIKVYCGVITNDFGKASLKFQELRCKYTDEEVKDFRINKDYMELRLTNGERYAWIKPTFNSRAYRCGKIIIDRNITFEELNEIILPMCYACGRNDVEMF